MTAKRHYSIFDKICLNLDQVVRALNDATLTTGRAYPGKATTNEPLSNVERKHSAALMRINHTGEICAQALYHGQGVVSKSAEIQEKMQQAAIEEGDHLAWCRTRIDELGSHTSYLNPLFYIGSFGIGMAAGFVGDEWSLGFVVETERQVIKHLQNHLDTLPTADERSYKILQQMEIDEAKHRDEAMASGARELPGFIKKIMALTSKIMVKMVYWV